MKTYQDLPLNNDIAARFLPFIVGVMVYLGALFSVFTFFVLDAAQSWEKQLTAHLTLELPAPAPGTADSLQVDVLDLLKKTPGIYQASAVPPKELKTLLHSLLGTGEKLDLPPLPTLIEVTFSGKAPVDVEALHLHLKKMSPEIQLIDHRDWQGQVLSIVRASVFLTSTLALLVLSMALVATRFAVQTSLLIHRYVIELLHLIGAPNGYIARQFQIHILKQGLIASSVGALLAFLTFWGLILLLENTGLLFDFKYTFCIQALCIFLLAPLITSSFMMLYARRTVLKGLNP